MLVVLDCDPNSAHHRMEGRGLKSRVVVDGGEVNESNITSKLDAYRKQYRVRVRGSRGNREPTDVSSTGSSPAGRHSDPGYSPTDAELAAKAIRLIQEEEQAFEKTIPYRILSREPHRRSRPSSRRRSLLSSGEGISSVQEPPQRAVGLQIALLSPARSRRAGPERCQRACRRRGTMPFRLAEELVELVVEKVAA